MKHQLLALLLLFAIGCKEETSKTNVSSTKITKTRSLESMIDHYKNPSDQYVMVIAHRGDWRNFLKILLKQFVVPSNWALTWWKLMSERL